MSPTGKEYLSLQEQLSSIKCIKNLIGSDDELLYLAFRSNAYGFKETNGIYVCMGTFMMENNSDVIHGPRDIRLKYDDPRAEYRYYKNLEDGMVEHVSIKRCPQFELMHKVIFPQTTNTEKFYNDLQMEFIKMCIVENQEEACRKILTRTIQKG